MVLPSGERRAVPEGANVGIAGVQTLRGGRKFFYRYSSQNLQRSWHIDDVCVLISSCPIEFHDFFSRPFDEIRFIFMILSWNGHIFSMIIFRNTRFILQPIDEIEYSHDHLSKFTEYFCADWRKFLFISMIFYQNSLLISAIFWRNSQFFSEIVSATVLLVHMSTWTPQRKRKKN